MSPFSTALIRSEEGLVSSRLLAKDVVTNKITNDAPAGEGLDGRSFSIRVAKVVNANAKLMKPGVIERRDIQVAVAPRDKKHTRSGSRAALCLYPSSRQARPSQRHTCQHRASCEKRSRVVETMV